MLRLPSEFPECACRVHIRLAANSEPNLPRRLGRPVRQNHSIGYVVDQTRSEYRRRNPNAQIRGVAEIRRLHGTGVRIRAAVHGEEWEHLSRFGRSHFRLRTYCDDRTIGLEEVGNGVVSAVGLGHFELRILAWTRSTRSGPGMAAAATSAVEARTQARSRFNIACDGIYLLKRGASVGEILGIDAGHRRTSACGSPAHSRVNRRNWRFGAATQAGCGASHGQENAPTDKRSLDRKPPIQTAAGGFTTSIIISDCAAFHEVTRSHAIFTKQCYIG